jgi:hypothetical protein
MNEIVYCRHGHVLNGQVPLVDETKFELQYPQYVGQVCDCGRFVYTENKCPTCSGDKWRIVWVDKSQYKSDVQL